MAVHIYGALNVDGSIRWRRTIYSSEPDRQTLELVVENAAFTLTGVSQDPSACWTVDLNRLGLDEALARDLPWLPNEGVFPARVRDSGAGSHRITVVFGREGGSARVRGNPSLSTAVRP